MTVCIAAIVEGLIVCISDKALTYGERTQWDADASKMTSPDNHKSIILMAGNEGPTDRVLRKLGGLTDIWTGNRHNLIEVLERKYKEAFSEEQELCVLHPEMMTRKDYLKAISGREINIKLSAISERVSDFKNIFYCTLLVCGFDQDKLPYIIRLESPGIVTDISSIGFAATGIGNEKAISRILFTEYKRSNSVAHTMYNCYDAKTFAEMAPGVGRKWEMCLITADGSVPVRDEAKMLIHSIWLKFNRSPFDKRKKGDFPSPSVDWRERLGNMIIASLKKREIHPVNEAERGK